MLAQQNASLEGHCTGWCEYCAYLNRFQGHCTCADSYPLYRPLLHMLDRSTQYKTVLDALRSRKDRFLFEDGEIGLKASVMAFM